MPGQSNIAWGSCQVPQRYFDRTASWRARDERSGDPKLEHASVGARVVTSRRQRERWTPPSWRIDLAERPDVPLDCGCTVTTSSMEAAWELGGHVTGVVRSSATSPASRVARRAPLVLGSRF